MANTEAIELSNEGGVFTMRTESGFELTLCGDCGLLFQEMQRVVTEDAKAKRTGRFDAFNCSCDKMPCQCKGGGNV